MQYSTEGLKGVLSWIIDNLGDVKTGLGDLDKKTADQIRELTANVTKNSEGVATNADEIAKLKKISNELDVRGQEDEKRVSELNVTVENLTMNVSMQHRTVIGLVEDHKELID